MVYKANENRYDTMKYNRTGNSGLVLPAISLGLWQNFGNDGVYSNTREMVLGAFDIGITHFDLANNYGPPAGTAETVFGAILKNDLKKYRDEIIISTKAGYKMWEGPYGDFGSKKYLVSSLDQSLQRMGLDYVDIFYHHRPDANTPLEETMDALKGIVHNGKALYVGISNYSPEDTKKANKILKSMGVRCLIHQPRYSMFERSAEQVFDVLDEEKMGAAIFSPLAQGMLSDKYLNGIPTDSRAGGKSIFLSKENLTEQRLNQIYSLNEIAKKRNQSLAQMALAWAIQRDCVTTALIGASRLSQIIENVKALDNLTFSDEELTLINTII